MQSSSDLTPNPIKTGTLYDERFKAIVEEIEEKEKNSAVGGGARRRLEKLTVAELKERAKKRNIKGYSSLRKAELIAALRRK